MGVPVERNLPADARFGSYTILERLGRGATATVYECRHERLGRRVAVKVLHAHLAGDPVVRARLLREGRALSQLRHPNIVDVCDVGELDGVPYLVMSAIDGRDLSEHLRVSGSLGIAEAVDCILPIIDALSCAHGSGIVHRDLKPGNIRLTYDHQGLLVPKILDFGVSKWTSQGVEADLTDTNGHLGTASYMAPEQIRSARSVDHRADVYAVGVILYEALTGQRPFRGQSGYEIMHAVLTAPVVAPRLTRPDVPLDLDRTVMRAMQRDPAERFASARELGVALAPFASNPATWLGRFFACAPPPSAPSIEPSSLEPSFTLSSGASSPARRTRRLRVAAMVTVAVAVLAGLNVRAMPARRSVPPPSPSRDVAVVGDTATSQATRLALTRPNAAPPIPPSPRDDLPQPPIAAAKDRPTSRDRTDSHRSEAAAAPPPSVVTKEFGTNGSPILE
jgi:serine/threonine protein kinase